MELIFLIRSSVSAWSDQNHTTTPSCLSTTSYITCQQVTLTYIPVLCSSLILFITSGSRFWEKIQNKKTSWFWVFENPQNESTYSFRFLKIFKEPLVLGFWKLSEAKNLRFWVFENPQNQSSSSFRFLKIFKEPLVLGFWKLWEAKNLRFWVFENSQKQSTSSCRFLKNFKEPLGFGFLKTFRIKAPPVPGFLKIFGIPDFEIFQRTNEFHERTGKEPMMV